MPPLLTEMKERISSVWKSAQLQTGPALQWLKLRPRVVFWAFGIGIALAFLVFSGATAAGAALLAWTALRQAETASERHQEQTNADRQRRITESFAKAVEQLGSDKLEVRLGGIYLSSGWRASQSVNSLLNAWMSLRGGSVRRVYSSSC
jgi:membrane protein implicated in regulation of membrane protease activity